MSSPICRQVEYIIVSNTIMIMFLLAYMLHMLLMIAYMFVPMYMIVLVVMRNMSLLIVVNMLAVVSAYANA